MRPLVSNLSWLLAGAILLFNVGCASVRSTTVYYTAYTTKVLPPKPADTIIPILESAPPERFQAIGRLAFSSSLGWRFMRASMVYNAQANGADAVILRKISVQRETTYMQVPPSVDWVPVSNYYRGKKGRTYGYTNWLPIYQPGYVQPYTNEITAIDAEMIVLKK